MSSSSSFDPASDNDGHNDLRVPGCGLPLNYWPELDAEGRFRHGAMDFLPPRLVAREISMLNLMNAITEKAEWHEKVFRQDIVDKWRSEATQHDLISDAAFDWCIREIKDKANVFKEKRFAVVFDSASPCVKSDILISPELQAELKAAVGPLLASSSPDWHPNSNDQVLNLVHPSLYPLVYGRSRVLRTGTVGLEDCINSVGKGEVVSAPTKLEKEPIRNWGERFPNDSFWSYRFQWLPSEVRFTGTGTEVKITTYINNLHPIHQKPLYHVVEKIISLSIPAWNAVLVLGEQGCLPPRIKTFGVEILDGELPGWAQDISKTEKASEEIRAKVRDYMALPNRPGYVVLDPNDEDFDEDEHILENWEVLEEWDLLQALYAKTKQIRRFIHPEPGQAYSYEDWKAGRVDNAVIPADYNGSVTTHDYYSVHLEDDFRQRGLQVMVKLASIELNPEKSSYGGGNWHLEGMLNEHIVATAIYYYDVKNTTESKIRFRQEASLPDEYLMYEQNDHTPLAEIFGCDSTSMHNTPAVQEIGSLSTPEGRLIAFPNTLQHRVEPFELADKNQPGHRRFLVLWLVDPNLRVMSTANVPPQQHEWWASEAKRVSGLRLPLEVMDMVMQETSDWPMGLEEAKQLRLQLMAERTAYADNVESYIGEYNLCEH